jgi:tRNA(Ile)-lysidine synthase TilS/MesJ
VIGDEACPAMRFDIKAPYARENTKNLLAKLEEENPQMFISMKAAFKNIQTSTFFDKKYIDETLDK